METNDTSVGIKPEPCGHYDDNDAKMCTTIRDAGCHNQECIDTNHVMKALERKLNRFNKSLLNNIGQKMK
jgi:hypothetical protein